MSFNGASRHRRSASTVATSATRREEIRHRVRRQAREGDGHHADDTGRDALHDGLRPREVSHAVECRQDREHQDERRQERRGRGRDGAAHAEELVPDVRRHHEHGPGVSWPSARPAMNSWGVSHCS